MRFITLNVKTTCLLTSVKPKNLYSQISEHKNHIRRNWTQHSVITDHRVEFSHDFDWDNVRILNEEYSYSKRLVSQMLYMKKQKTSLNLQSDIDFLGNACIPLVDKFI